MPGEQRKGAGLGIGHVEPRDACDCLVDRLTDTELRNVPESFRLIPGMTLVADVHIGTRSLLMYIVNGAVQGLNEAMREP